jgi:nucleotide-binding universal stress UspA family protein
MSITLAKILLATDGSKDADLAARAAMDLSNRTGAELHVVHARQDVRLAGMPPTVTQDEYTRALERWEQEDREFLEEQAERLRSAGGTVTGAHLKKGRPADEIAGLAEELGASLIAMGSRGLGTIKRLVVGSVSEGVVSLAPCPVLVVRG